MSTDPALWTDSYDLSRAASVVSLTREGRERAFSVGAQVRPGEPVRALMALAALGGFGAIERREGSRISMTELGRHTLGLAYLTDHGLVELVTGEARSVRLTGAGAAAVKRGYAEQEHLLERCRHAASTKGE